MVETDDRTVALAGQCAFRASELRSGQPSPTNLDDDTCHDTASASLARIRSLAPIDVHLSHDTEVVSLR